jgi:hypothetical protein
MSLGIDHDERNTRRNRRMIRDMSTNKFTIIQVMAIMRNQFFGDERQLLAQPVDPSLNDCGTLSQT